MSDLFRHLRHAGRSLRRSPDFALSAALTLAVCIGANVAVFSMVDTLLLRPLPFPDAGRLVMIEKGGARGPNMLRLDVAPWMREMRAFSSVGLFTAGTLNLSGGIEPVHLKAAMVSPGFFAVLGIAPALGRTLRAEDHEKGGAYAVVLSDGLWKRMFGADPSVAGRMVQVNGRLTLVVGVMPPGFGFPDGSELWAPATIAETPFLGGLRQDFIARLRPEATVAQARAEGLMAGRQNIPKAPPTYSFDVVPLHDVLAGPIRPTLLLFLAAVAVVLLVGCANVANLVLARLTGRKAEMAVRAALGAGRMAIMSQALVEILLVALAGGLLGLLLAKASLSTLLALLPPDVAGLDRVAIDARAAGVALALSLASMLLVGLPAARIGRVELHEATRGAGQGLRTGHRYLPRVFAVAQMALAVLLSAGAALVGKSFVQLANADPGFQPRHVLTMSVSMMNRPYRAEPGVTPKERAARERARILGGYREILDRLRSVPGVESAAAVNGLPMNLRLPMRAPVRTEGAGPVLSTYRAATRGYFSTMKIPLIAGEDFADPPADRRTVIVSRGLARRLWGKDWRPGSRVQLWDDGPWADVIGVVGDVRSAGLEVEAPPEVYEPHSATQWPVMSLAVRTAGDPAALAGALREQIRSAAPSVPVFQVQPMERVVGSMLARRRASMLVLGLFAACAVLLAGVGVYGVSSYLVGLRTREFGIRLALGAGKRQVLREVLQRSAIDSAIAAVLGIAGAIALSRLLTSFLVNVAPTDPAVLALTCIALVAVGLAGSFVPARRASSVDAAITLRTE
ncbi:MAG TPA: ABC transporter permease [Vicinamibacterales bacterium]|nr:ABC transporter permease [Vicinamibacterales bacterium]